MGVEIERKFLVKEGFNKLTTKEVRIRQGYLSSVPERTVRIRIRGDQAFLTIKGIPNDSGVSRYEWEKEIPLNEGVELLKLCEPGIIDKTRYMLPEKQGLIFEVDEFYGLNRGLILAEIELPSEDYDFDRPPWLGEEVTGDPRYYNSALSKKPYSKWKKKK